MQDKPPEIGMLLYPQLTLLDLFGSADSALRAWQHPLDLEDAGDDSNGFRYCDLTDGHLERLPRRPGRIVRARRAGRN